MFDWIKSVRALSAIIFVVGLHIALFMGKITVELYSQAAMLVIGAYFARRDTNTERGND